MDKKKTKFPFFIVISLCLSLLIIIALHINQDFAVLNPKGPIALKQRDLILFVTALMLIVVIPVFILTFSFIWKYRAHNSRANYSPDWDRNRKIESAWWAIPCVIIIFIAIAAWKNSTALDPFRPIDQGKKSLRIQVVALQWKWLFIYPEQNIAVVNFVQFPKQTPIDFEITADAPMNSFWIPQLAGQIYAMPGMKTHLHLMADEIGQFRGSSANLSGDGFAGMTFTAQASSQEEFDLWVQSIQQSPSSLTKETYDQLVNPSSYHPIVPYSLADAELYDEIVMKYMVPHANQ